MCEADMVINNKKRRSPLGKLKGLVAYYRQGGTLEALRRLSGYGYLPPAVLSLSTRQILELDKTRQPPLRYRPSSYDIVRADRTAVPGLVACQGRHIETPGFIFERFFADGHACYTARKAGEIVAYFWLFRGRYRLAFDALEKCALMLTLKDNEVFFGNGFIAESHRMKGLFPLMIKAITAQYPADTRFFSAVDSINEGSLRAHRRYGFVNSLEVLHVRAFCRSLFFCRHMAGSIASHKARPVTITFSPLPYAQRACPINLPTRLPDTQS